jgi:hypothetical protein
LEDVANVSGGHLLGQGDVDGDLNSAEPRSTGIKSAIMPKPFGEQVGLTHGE